MGMEITSENLANFREFTSGLVEKLKEKPQLKDEATLVCLSGNLGSGKTTLTQLVAEILGVKESVTSPTFVIEKIYKLDDDSFDHLIHIDAYRLKRGEELESLGWQEIIGNKKNLIFLEWPENVENILPKDSIKIKLEILEGEKRKINFKL